MADTVAEFTEDEYFYPNGVDGETGGLLQRRLSCASVAAAARRLTPDSSWLIALQEASRAQQDLGPPPGSEDLAQAGWAYVCHRDEAQEVRDALETLASHRRAQITATHPERAGWVKSFEHDGTQSVEDWLADKRVGLGEYKPARVPFYLLVAGSPERIPLAWSLALDLDYAVGRIHFEHAAEYRRYVQSVIDYETGRAPRRAKEAVFFGTRHRYDTATIRSAQWLVDPLADGIPEDEEPGVAAASGFATRKLTGEAATRQALQEVLAPADGSLPPAFLFTATHGVVFKPSSHDAQLAGQGALVCQDWRGPGFSRAEYAFGVKDIPDAGVHGLIAFMFACYSAATPLHDSFWSEPGATPPAIANRPFLAALPKAMLSHERGGALACIGHTERAWSSSFRVPRAGLIVQPFQWAIKYILEGKPVGYAVSTFLERYARLGHDLNELLKQLRFGVSVEDARLASVWTRYHDAGGYLVIGDPAVRLRLEDL